MMQLCKTLKRADGHALGGKSMSNTTSYDVGMTGFIGFSSGYAAMHACDMLLMLGTDFPTSSSSRPIAEVAQVDIRPRKSRPALQARSRRGSVMSARPSERCLPLLNVKSERAHLDNAHRALQKAREG